MAKKSDDENANSGNNGTGGNTPPPVVQEKKTVKYRNITTHKVEFGFQKGFHSLKTGEDIVIDEAQEENFLNEHGRTNFFSKVVEEAAPVTTEA